jgi:hypothetical protein
MALRKENEALTLGLGVGVHAAKAIDSKLKELSREFKNSPLKGVRHRTTLFRDQQKRQEREEAFREKQFNPKVRGLQGVKGVTTNEDGTIGLADLREQRPDIFDMRPKQVAGSDPNTPMRKIHEAIKARGGKDRYGNKFDD